MTKRRSPLTFELALTRIAGRIGWENAATIVGKSESTIRNWSDHDTSAGIRIDAALDLDIAYRLAGGDGAPMLQCYATRLEVDMPQACPDVIALCRAVAIAAKEGGEAIHHAILASQPGATDAALVRAELELQEAIEAHTVALAKLRSRRGGHNDFAPGEGPGDQDTTSNEAEPGSGPGAPEVAQPTNV